MCTIDNKKFDSLKAWENHSALFEYNTTASIVTSTLAQDIGALVFPGMSIESFNQEEAIFSTTGGCARKRAEEQLNADWARDLCTSASTMSMADL